MMDVNASSNKRVNNILAILSYLFCIFSLHSSALKAEELSANKDVFLPSPFTSIAAGTFIQRKYFTVLKQPIVSSGDIFFETELGFYWQTNKPVRSVMLLKSDGLYIAEQGSPSKKINGANNLAEVLMNLMSGRTERLKEEFIVSKGQSENCNVLHPRDNMLSKIIQSIELCSIVNLDGDALHKGEKTDRIVLYETSGNKTEIEIALFALQELPEVVREKLQ